MMFCLFPFSYYPCLSAHHFITPTHALFRLVMVYYEVELTPSQCTIVRCEWCSSGNVVGVAVFLIYLMYVANNVPTKI